MSRPAGRMRLVPGWLFLVGLLLFPGPGSAQAPAFFIEAVSLPHHEGAPATFLVLTVPDPVSGFRYFVTVEIRGPGGEVELDKNWVISAKGYPAHAGAPLQRRFLLRLAPGEYRGRVGVEDMEREAATEARLEFQVPDTTGSGIMISDLVVGACPQSEGPLSPGGESLPPGGESLPPWGAIGYLAERRFGDSQPHLCLWAQLRDFRSDVGDSLYAVWYWIKDARGRTLEKQSVSVFREDGLGVVRLQPDIASLTHERYTLVVEAALRGEKVRRETWFAVDESRLSFLEEEEKLRQVLSYVATNRERLELERAPRDSLASIWERFWARRDPVPRTPANEAMVEFMRRVDHAANHFGTLEPGWNTDRGRIYIQFGPPDRQERVDRDPSGLPTLLWYYYDRQLTFVFQDPRGLGAYQLTGRRRRS